MGKFRSFIDSKFHISERGSSIGTEIIAGITTFVTMAYVLAVQPGSIIGYVGSSFTDVNGVTITSESLMIMCALISGVITLGMAFYANLPFALSTGMGSNFMFGALIQSGTMPLGGAMAITLVSGVIFIILTAVGIRDLIVKMIPKNLKIGIGTSIGFFIAYLGFKNSAIGSFTNGINLGSFANPAVLLALGTLFLISALEALKVKGGILIGMIVATIVGIFIKVPNAAGELVAITNMTGVVSLPNFSGAANVIFNFDFKSVFNWAAIPLLFITFCGDFFSTLGTVLGVGKKANMLDENGNFPNIGKPFLVDAVGTAVGACFGCTTITTFVESASGVEAGGKTGFTSLITGVLFLLSMFFAPLFTSIPNAATGPALIYIGFLMISGFKDIDFSDFTECFAPFVMLVFTAFAGGIAVGISMGILSHVFIKLVSGRAKEVHVGLYVLSIPLILYFVAQALM